jgi:hypothetical protein
MNIESLKLFYNNIISFILAIFYCLEYEKSLNLHKLTLYNKKDIISNFKKTNTILFWFNIYNYYYYLILIYTIIIIIWF